MRGGRLLDRCHLPVKSWACAAGHVNCTWSKACRNRIKIPSMHVPKKDFVCTQRRPSFWKAFIVARPFLHRRSSFLLPACFLPCSLSQNSTIIEQAQILKASLCFCPPVRPLNWVEQSSTKLFIKWQAMNQKNLWKSTTIEPPIDTCVGYTLQIPH